MEKLIISYLTILFILITFYALNKSNIDIAQRKVFNSIHFPQFILTRHTNQFLL